MGSATHPTAKLSVLQNYHPTHPIYILTATKKPVNKKIEKNSGSKSLEERGQSPPLLKAVWPIDFHFSLLTLRLAKS
jgi:hypothetical protein